MTFALSWKPRCVDPISNVFQSTLIDLSRRRTVRWRHNAEYCSESVSQTTHEARLLPFSARMIEYAMPRVLPPTGCRTQRRPRRRRTNSRGNQYNEPDEAARRTPTVNGVMVRKHQRHGYISDWRQNLQAGDGMRRSPQRTRNRITLHYSNARCIVAATDR